MVIRRLRAMKKPPVGDMPYIAKIHLIMTSSRHEKASSWRHVIHCKDTLDHDVFAPWKSLQLETCHTLQRYTWSWHLRTMKKAPDTSYIVTKGQKSVRRAFFISDYWQSTCCLKACLDISHYVQIVKQLLTFQFTMCIPELHHALMQGQSPKARRHTARLFLKMLWCGKLCSARNRHKIFTETSCALMVSGATIHHSMGCQLRLHSCSRYFC